MAHRIYQGKTGVVWNITQRSVGVLLKKKVGNRYRTKRLHVRIEHVGPSGCRKDFLHPDGPTCSILTCNRQDVGRISFKDANLTPIMLNSP